MPKLRELTLKDLGGGYDYKAILGYIAGAPERNEAGQIVTLDYKAIVQRGELADELEAANGTIRLTAEQYKLILRLASQFHWPSIATGGVLNKSALDHIRELMTDLEQAPEVSV